MFSDEVIAVITQAIQSDIGHPLGSMRVLPETEEELALTILNALDAAGFDIVSRSEQSTS